MLLWSSCSEEECSNIETDQTKDTTTFCVEPYFFFSRAKCNIRFVIFVLWSTCFHEECPKSVTHPLQRVEITPRSFITQTCAICFSDGRMMDVSFNHFNEPYSVKTNHVILVLVKVLVCVSNHPVFTGSSLPSQYV